MKVIVCDMKNRPPIPNRWRSSKPLRLLSQLATECWYHDAAARLTALRVQKSIKACLTETPGELSGSDVPLYPVQMDKIPGNTGVDPRAIFSTPPPSSSSPNQVSQSGHI